MDVVPHLAAAGRTGGPQVPGVVDPLHQLCAVTGVATAVGGKVSCSWLMGDRVYWGVFLKCSIQDSLRWHAGLSACPRACGCPSVRQPFLSCARSAAGSKDPACGEGANAFSPALESGEQDWGGGQPPGVMVWLEAVAAVKAWELLRWRSVESYGQHEPLQCRQMWREESREECRRFQK